MPVVVIPLVSVLITSALIIVVLGASGLFTHPRDVLDALKNILADGSDLIRRSNKFFERARHSADAAFDSGRHKLREQIEKAVGVSDTFGGSPIGRINFFFDRPAVKSAVGKSIDRKNVTLVLLKPFAKGAESGGMGQFVRRAFAQAQADGIKIFWADPFAHGERVILERLKCLAPVLATMDVRAVGEVKSVVEFHEINSITKWRKRQGRFACHRNDI